MLDLSLMLRVPKFSSGDVAALAEYCQPTMRRSRRRTPTFHASLLTFVPLSGFSGFPNNQTTYHPLLIQLHLS